MPLIELQLAIRALQSRGQQVWLDAWRRRARTQLPTPAPMALSLIPPHGPAPAFVSPALAGTPEVLFTRVRATPLRAIVAGLDSIAAQRIMPTWARHLTDDEDARKQLVTELTVLYNHLLRPYWTGIADDLTHDRTVRAREFIAGGVESVLAHIDPQAIRWNPPVLEVRTVTGVDRELQLAGQGVLLIPSVFATGSIVGQCDEVWPQPVVIHPAAMRRPIRRLAALGHNSSLSRSTAPVAALLGRTRATVLELITDHPGCSTTELATLAKISSASASQHATVLRQAGLVRTMRHRNTVLHAPTHLGAALLNNQAHSSSPSQHQDPQTN